VVLKGTLWLFSIIFVWFDIKFQNDFKKGKRDPNRLVHALEGLLDKLSINSWDALNKDQLWFSKRPVWIQALIQLIGF